jgi:hypothetical protein
VNNENLLHEHTLLIDPCYDDPEDYLGFDLSGGILSVDGNPYGRKTIKVFNLKRRRLRDLRLTKVRRIVKILKLKRKYEQDGNDAVAEDFGALLEDEKVDTEEFAAIARYVDRNPEVFGIE